MSVRCVDHETEEGEGGQAGGMHEPRRQYVSVRWVGHIAGEATGEGGVACISPGISLC